MSFEVRKKCPFLEGEGGSDKIFGERDIVPFYGIFLFWRLPLHFLLTDDIFREGISEANSLYFMFTLQKEIFVQAVANMGALSVPLLVQVYTGHNSPVSGKMKRNGLNTSE